MANRVWPVNAQSGAPQYSGRMLRQASIAPLVAGATASRPLGARSGVRPGTPASTVTATSTTWTVRPHAGVLDLHAAAEAGPYGYAIDADVTGAVTAASSTIARVDIVWARIDDPSESDGSSAPGVVVGYTAGTVAATPPATPARSMVLAWINIPIAGGGSPTITWVAPYLAAPGTAFKVRSDTERDALYTAYGATAEAPLWVEHIGASNPRAGALERRAGSDWQVAWLPPATATFAVGGLWNLAGTPSITRVGLVWTASITLTQKSAGGISAGWTAMGTVSTEGRVPGGGIVYGAAKVSGPEGPAFASIDRGSGAVQVHMPAFTGTTGTTFLIALQWAAV